MDNDTSSEHSSSDAKRLRNAWESEEDEALRRIVAKKGAKDWIEVAKHVPGRSHVQCRQRWDGVLRPGLTKGKWTKQEDGFLTAAVKTYLDAKEVVDWSKVSRCVTARTAKQCRERWHFHLDPSIVTGPWTMQEDFLLVELHREHGNRWAFIAKSFPGRTEYTVRSRIRGIQRANKRAWKVMSSALPTMFETTK
jgi:hypothetical protein